MLHGSWSHTCEGFREGAQTMEDRAGVTSRESSGQYVEGVPAQASSSASTAL